MPLFSFTAELKPMVVVLTRIADALDRMHPPAVDTSHARKLTREDMYVDTADKRRERIVQRGAESMLGYVPRPKKL